LGGCHDTSEQHAGQWFEGGSLDLALGDRRLHHLAYERQCVSVCDLAANVSRKYGRTVDGADALHRRIQHGVEIGVASGPQHLERMFVTHLHGRLRRGCDDLLLELLVDGPEEALLVAEVVLQRPACHAGVGHYLLTRRAAVTIAAEQLAPRRHERRARRLGALGLRATRRCGGLPLDHICKVHVTYMPTARYRVW